MVSHIRKQRTSVETVWPTRTTDRCLRVHDARFIEFCRLTGRNDRMSVAACTYDNCRRWRFTTVRTVFSSSSSIGEKEFFFLKISRQKGHGLRDWNRRCAHAQTVFNVQKQKKSTYMYNTYVII